GTNRAGAGLRLGVIDCGPGGKFAEIAGAHGDGRDRLQVGGGAREISVPIIVGKEKDFVFPDGAADKSAEFVLVIGGFGRGEEAPSVQRRVAEVLEGRAME